MSGCTLIIEKYGVKKYGKSTERNGMATDYPDFRDYTFEINESLDKNKKKEIENLISPTGIRGANISKLPSSVDLRPWCSKIENQGQIGSCTANAGQGSLNILRTELLENT